MDAIRRYLLLGQGDFIQFLMENMTGELDKQASHIRLSTLTSLVEQAIRSSNAQFHDSRFLDRLEVMMLEPSPGDNGWDVFSLNYQAQDLPSISTIFNKEVMKKYLKVFQFLWRVKRVEHTLNLVARQHMSSGRVISRSREISRQLHKSHLLRNHMGHFVSNFMNYLMVVLESTWKTFIDRVNGVKNLNELIKVHEQFVDEILHRFLLG